MKTTKIKAALSAIYINPFRDESCYDDYNAQRNLSGRTHYADPDTLKCFRATITECHITHDGLILSIVESVRSKPASIPGGHFRAVIFDVFGDEVTDCRDTWHSSTAAASKALQAELAKFDVVAHYKAKIREKLTGEIARARAALKLLPR